MLDPSSAPASERDRRRRRLETLGSAAFLLFQLAVPLHYYLGSRDYDERFSWRMFSSVRLRDCRVHVVETPREAGTNAERPVAIERDVQVAWVHLLERMRTGVVDKYLQRRCEQADVERVQYLGACKDTDGSALPELRRERRCSAAERGRQAAP
jgi:hypothetical protein